MTLISFYTEFRTPSGHKQLRLRGQEALNAKHPQPPNHQLIKLALRA